MGPRARLLALIIGSGFALASCSNDGRTLRPPRPDQTATVKTVPTTVATSSSSGVAASIGSSSLPALSIVAPWEEGGGIPTRYTCNGLDVSPALQWDGVPAEPIELVLVMRDIDGDGFIHWLMAGIDPASNSIGEGKIPRAATIATNGFGRAAYGGPCPTSGERRYLITLYVLSRPSGITTGMPANEAFALLEGAGGNSTSITGYFAI